MSEEKIPDQILGQIEKDREILASLPKGVNKPLSWCGPHDCRLSTCFPLHYPTAVPLEE